MTRTKVRVTLIDDDPAARPALARHLRDEQFDLVETEAGTCARPDAPSGPQCVILAMPNAGPDSYQSIRDFRSADDRPMIALNVRDHPVDRIVALDMMTVLIVSFCGLYALQSGQRAFVDVAIVLALVGFLATVALARFAERQRARRENGETGQ